MSENGFLQRFVFGVFKDLYSKIYTNSWCILNKLK